MTDYQNQIDQLLQRLNTLSDKQALFWQEMNQIRREVYDLQEAQERAEQQPVIETPAAEQEEVFHSWQPPP